MYGGKFAFQNQLGLLAVGRKFTIFALFTLYLRANSKYKPPRGLIFERGDLTEGFLRYDFGGAFIWMGLFSEFYGIKEVVLVIVFFFF